MAEPGWLATRQYPAATGVPERGRTLRLVGACRSLGRRTHTRRIDTLSGRLRRVAVCLYRNQPDRAQRLGSGVCRFPVRSAVTPCPSAAAPSLRDHVRFGLAQFPCLAAARLSASPTTL